MKHGPASSENTIGHSFLSASALLPAATSSASCSLLTLLIWLDSSAVPSIFGRSKALFRGAGSLKWPFKNFNLLKLEPKLAKMFEK